MSWIVLQDAASDPTQALLLDLALSAGLHLILSCSTEAKYTKSIVLLVLPSSWSGCPNCFASLDHICHWMVPLVSDSSHWNTDYIPFGMGWWFAYRTNSGIRNSIPDLLQGLDCHGFLEPTLKMSVSVDQIPSRLTDTIS